MSLWLLKDKTKTRLRILIVAPCNLISSKCFIYQQMHFVSALYPSIRFYNSCRRLPETKRHSSLFLQRFFSKFLVVMAACTPSIHVFLGRPLFLLSSGKGKAVPLQAWSGPEGSRKLRFPDYMTTAQDGGKVVSLTHRPLFTPQEILLVLISVRG